MKRTFKMMVSVATVLMCMFALVSVSSAETEGNFTYAISSEGATITGYVCRRDDSSTTYAPVYHYWANGQEYEKTSTFSSSRRKHNTGDKITLYYDSSNPKIIYVEEEQSVLNLISVIFHLLGTVFMGIGVVVIFCTYYVR